MDLFENQSPVHVDGYMTDLITERSIKFIDDHAEAPFFLEVTYNAAHWPFQVPDHPSVAAGHARFVQPEENNGNAAGLHRHPRAGGWGSARFCRR